MQHFFVRDNSFDLTNYSEYDLSIQTSLDGFSFIIRELTSGKILLIANHPFSLPSNHLVIRKINEILAENEFLNQSFAKTTIVFGDPCFTLIPEPLFSAKLADHLLSPGQKHPEETETVVIPVSWISAFLAFTAGKELLNFLTIRFPGAGITHEVYPLIRNIFSANDPVLSFHLHNKWFYAIGFSEGNITFLNVFEYLHVSDLVYFMLSVMEQPELHGLPVSLSGWINPDDPVVTAVRKYIPGAEMAVAKEDSPLFSKEIPYRYLPGIIF